MTRVWEYVRAYAVEIVLTAVLVGVLALVAWQLAVTPSCEELGGRLYQTGTHQETYVVYTMKIGEVSVPIYGTRTVADFDCVGTR